MHRAVFGHMCRLLLRCRTDLERLEFLQTEMAISLQAEDKEALLRKQVIQSSVWAFMCV